MDINDQSLTIAKAGQTGLKTTNANTERVKLVTGKTDGRYPQYVIENIFNAGSGDMSQLTTATRLGRSQTPGCKHVMNVKF